MPNRTFAPGIRLSVLDVAVLLFGIVGTIARATENEIAALVVGFALGHFFLFCNIFRHLAPIGTGMGRRVRHARGHDRWARISELARHNRGIAADDRHRSDS